MAITFRISAFLGLLLATIGPGACDDLDCKLFTQCHCILKNNSVINLEPLGNTNNNPRFEEKVSKEASETLQGDTVLYNPCKPFSDTDQCKDATACYRTDTSTLIKNNIILVKGDGVQWKSTVKLNYSNTIDKDFRTLIVNLHCDTNLKPEESHFTITKVTQIPENTTGLHIEADLYSKCACLDGCPLKVDPAKEDSSGLSTGSILLIVFFVLSLVYLIGGIIYNKVVHGAIGKELIPNISFWTEFPKLVLDGTTFTCNCCRSRKTSTGYDNM